MRAGSLPAVAFCLFGKNFIFKVVETMEKVHDQTEKTTDMQRCFVWISLFRFSVVTTFTTLFSVFPFLRSMLCAIIKVLYRFVAFRVVFALILCAVF